MVRPDRGDVYGANVLKRYHEKHKIVDEIILLYTPNKRDCGKENRSLMINVMLTSSGFIF